MFKDGKPASITADGIAMPEGTVRFRVLQSTFRQRPAAALFHHLSA